MSRLCLSRQQIVFFCFILMLAFFQLSLPGFALSSITKQVRFTPNHGQWDPRVNYRAEASGLTFWFAGQAVYCEMISVPQLAPDSGTGVVNSQDIQREVMKVRLIGARDLANPTAIARTGYKQHFLKGNEPSGWYRDIPSYEKIRYTEVYPGIDLVYYGRENLLEYDFILEPQADPELIQIEYSGQIETRIDSDVKLLITTELGQISEMILNAYQMENGSRRDVDVSFKQIENNLYGFNIDSNYDPDQALTIDPLVTFSTYLGGSADDHGRGMALDDSGSAVMVGYTYSNDFPVKNDMYGVSPNAEVFVSRFTPDGSDLIFSTYIGGDADDFGLSVDLDTIGEIYFSGYSLSDDYPVRNSLDVSVPGTDVIVSKLTASGDSLVYSTFLSGYLDEYANCIAVDDSFRAVITGYTYSTNYPVVNPIQTDQGSSDMFVTRIDSACTAILFSTYLGGSSSEIAYGIDTDDSGHIYVTGYTNSSDFPTVNQYQGDQPYRDAVALKIDNFGDSLQYSTYLGGSSFDWADDIAVDDNYQAYILGSTSSSDFPYYNEYQAYNGGHDAFIAKLTQSGDSLVYSTYFGGSSDDFGFGLDLDSTGSAFFTGQTWSADFPQVSALQPAQGGSDAFAVKLNVNGSSPVYSTYLGGSGNDDGYEIVAYTEDTIYVFGQTRSSDFPTVNPYQGDQGNQDIFLTKMFGCIDIDQDQVCDDNDNCPSIYNPDQADLDGDSLGDACDDCTDSDGDGYGNPGYPANTCQNDNCPDLHNPAQSDTDSDQVGDLCDNCPAVANPGQGDSDADGFGDLCDVCPGYDDNIDADGDGVPDGCDICPGYDDSIDSDGDSVPDGCDICPGFDDLADDDTDNIPDGCDNCPNTANSDQLDSDGDGSGDLCDICPGYDDSIDSDGDSVPDGCDICPGFDDLVDTDSDSVPDGCDICQGYDDSIDSDGDAVPDGCDVCPGFDDFADGDSDTVPDSCDNCPQTTNTDQVDSDNDSFGDVCDVCPGYDDNLDSDDDTVPDGCDVCPGYDDLADSDSDSVPDSCDICHGFDDNIDTDGDSVPDGCDICPGFDDFADGDSDTVPDSCDNCPATANSDQIDSDGDDVGDICDVCPGYDDNIDSDDDNVPDGCDICPGFDDNLDQDLDSVPDGCDNCVAVFNPGQEDRDSDGSGDSCDICPDHPLDDCCNPIGINSTPQIVSAVLDSVQPSVEEYVYIAEYFDPDCDGSELTSEILNYPSWCTLSGDTLHGFVECSYDDTGFTIVVSDGDLADTLEVIIAVDTSNVDPHINAPDSLYWRDSFDVAYYPEIADPDDSNHSISYLHYPNWMIPSGDSLVGTTPATADTDSLQVTVEDFCGSDSASIVLRVYIKGDVNGDLEIDVADAVYLVNYIFAAGPVPEIIASGDLTCDDQISISDAVAIINFIFVGGSEPGDIDGDGNYDC